MQLRCLSIFKSFPELNIQFSVFSKEENKGATAYLNALGRECGCNAGGFVMSMAFAATIAYYFITGGRFSAIGWHQVIILGWITAATAFTGKLYGLLRARWKMMKYTNSLLHRIAVLNVII